MNSEQVEQFQCSCGCCESAWVLPDPELAALVDFLEATYLTKAIITSGYRCKARNAKIGANARSQHVLRKAADVFIPGRSPLNS